MKISHAPTIVALTSALLLGACNPVVDYSAAEAPKKLALDSSTTRVDLRFGPGTAHLSPADAARLRQLAATGTIGAADRVLVAAAGPPDLAARRAGAISSQLLHYGIVASPIQLADMRPDRGLVEITRTLVTLPACPNWSKPAQPGFDNQPSSNHGCAAQLNLGLMVAHPTDLASGTPLGMAEGQPAAAAMNRYLNDKVTPLPQAGNAKAFSSGASTTTATPTGSQ